MHRTWSGNAALIAAVAVLVGLAAFIRENRNGNRDQDPPTSAPAGAALPRLLDLGSDQCLPCRQMSPVLVELTREYAGKAVIEFIDVWKDPAAAKPYRIRVIPTQIFFDRAGREVWRHEGFLSKAEIVARFRELGVE